MNTYEMVERIIELTAKGKIEWRDWVVIYQGWYKGMHLEVLRKNRTFEAMRP